MSLSLIEKLNIAYDSFVSNLLSQQYDVTNRFANKIIKSYEKDLIKNAKKGKHIVSYEFNSDKVDSYMLKQLLRCKIDDNITVEIFEAKNTNIYDYYRSISKVVLSW